MSELIIRHAQPRVPTILAVRTPIHKLFTYPDFEKWTDLFDLEADPDVMRNLVGYNNATNRHIEMCNMLQQLVAETGYAAKPSRDQWLIGITHSYAAYQAHARLPVASRRPPLLIPDC